MTNRNALYFGITTLAVIIGCSYFFRLADKKAVIVNPQNSTYVINGQNVTFINGRAEQEVAPGSASKTVTLYFGNEAVGDFNGDGMQDTAFILTQTAGGSGTFYYVALALGSQNGVTGTNAIFLGDRIAPQSTNFLNGEIVVNYVERKFDEPMTEIPSVGVSKYFQVIGERLVRIEK